MTAPLVVIGVDAADARLVRKWAGGEGYLPTFEALLESGLVAPVVTPLGVLEGGIWPTLLTSSSAATHGMFSFQALKPDTYDIENGMYADRLPAPPFWTHMGRGGNRVAVVDAPFAPTHRAAQWPAGNGVFMTRGPGRVPLPRPA